MYLSHSKYYVPACRIPSAEVAEEFGRSFNVPEFSDADEYLYFLTKTLKLGSVRKETSLNELEMLYKVVEQAISSASASGLSIDAIIVADTHTRPQDLVKSIQQRLGIARAYSAVISGNHCANFEFAIHFARALLKAEETLHNVLIAGAVITPNVASRVIGSYAVLGDAAGAAILSRGGGDVRVVDQTVICTSTLNDTRLGVGSSLLQAKHYVTLLNELLQRNPSTKERISHIITQNANGLLVSQCISTVGLQSSRVFQENAGRYGHLHCLDFVVNLTDLLQSGLARQSDMIVAIGSGWNGSYIASLLELT